MNSTSGTTRKRNFSWRRSASIFAMALLASTGTVSAAEFEFGGYVKVDAIYDLDADLGPILNADRVPTDPDASSDPSFRIHAQQTRLNAGVTHNDMFAFVEIDFFGDGGTETVSNSYQPRLRHAYGQMGNLLVGQTWSTFMDANWVYYPATVDFAGAAGTTFVRQGLFRWTLNEGLDVAVENPENRVRGAESRDAIPDLVLRYFQTGDVTWQVSGVLQQFSVDDGAADGESEFNLGLSGGVNFKLGNGKNSISLQSNLNANRYTYYGFSNPSAVVVGDSIELIDHTSLVVAYNHDWGGAQTTIAFGMVAFEDDHLAGDDIDTISTIHANYRWQPYESIDYLLEISRAAQELVNGDDGDNIRLQFAVQYNFQ
jgi:hypothetical protein